MKWTDGLVNSSVISDSFSHVAPARGGGTRLCYGLALAGLLLLAMSACAPEPSHRGDSGDPAAPLMPQPPISTPQPQPPEQPPGSMMPPPAMSGAVLEARVLVLAADGTESALPAITRSLDYSLVPYNVVIASKYPEAQFASLLASGTHGNYQGVILTSGSLAYTPDRGKTWVSALSDAEWQTLWQYEAAFGVRQVTYYTYPTADLGFGPGTATGSDAAPYRASFNADPTNVFGSVNRESGLGIRNAYIYLSPPAQPKVGESITPLLSDARGNALALIKKYADGRENLALTFDSNPYLVHTLQIAHAVISWVTRGLYVGEHRVYASAQVDDVFIPDDLWTPAGVKPGATYRINAADLDALVKWQTAVRNSSLTAGFRLDMAFNGVGTMPGEFAGDDLTPAAKRLQAEFKWISHTWDHEQMDALSYAAVQSELSQNITRAPWLGLTDFDSQTLITPEVSGLRNAEAMRSAKDVGIRFLVSDTSRPGEDNPVPNSGIYNALQPLLFEIPRRPTNLYYNVSTNAEWLGEYNEFYGPGGRWPTWDHALSFDELLDKESDVLVQYLLRGEMDPWMFHQSNLRNSAGGTGTPSTLAALLDRTFAKYRALMTLPITSPTMLALGTKMKRVNELRAASVTAVITPGKSLTLTATRPCYVPVTGIRTATAQPYAGQYSDWIFVDAGATVTIPITP